MSLPVAILAGGLATRLRPITETIPKSLVDVNGKPFIIRQLEYLSHQGISQIILCLGYLGDQVEKVVGNGSDFGLKVSYSYDGPKLMGTGGALRQALPLLGEHFFVFYGDSYLPIDFQSVELGFHQSGKPALMTVLKNNGQWDRSNVIFSDGKILEYNKHEPKPEMTYIDYGLGVMLASVLENEPLDEPFDLGTVYQRLSLQGMLTGYEVFTRFYEIGSHTGLQDTIDYFNKDVIK